MVCFHYLNFHEMEFYAMVLSDIVKNLSEMNIARANKQSLKNKKVHYKKPIDSRSYISNEFLNYMVKDLSSILYCSATITNVHDGILIEYKSECKPKNEDDVRPTDIIRDLYKLSMADHLIHLFLMANRKFPDNMALILNKHRTIKLKDQVISEEEMNTKETREHIDFMNNKVFDCIKDIAETTGMKYQDWDISDIAEVQDLIVSKLRKKNYPVWNPSLKEK